VEPSDSFTQNDAVRPCVQRPKLRSLNTKTTKKRCGIAMDITMEKTNEELAREITDMTLKSKLKSEFFATMSHEIRKRLCSLLPLPPDSLWWRRW